MEGLEQGSELETQMASLQLMQPFFGVLRGAAADALGMDGKSPIGPDRRSFPENRAVRIPARVGDLAVIGRDSVDG